MTGEMRHPEAFVAGAGAVGGVRSRDVRTR
jgi:hypothetical protein